LLHHVIKSAKYLARHIFAACSLKFKKKNTQILCIYIYGVHKNYRHKNKCLFDLKKKNFHSRSSWTSIKSELFLNRKLIASKSKKSNFVFFFYYFYFSKKHQCLNCFYWCVRRFKNKEKLVYSHQNLTPWLKSNLENKNKSSIKILLTIYLPRQQNPILTEVISWISISYHLKKKGVFKKRNIKT